MKFSKSIFAIIFMLFMGLEVTSQTEFTTTQNLGFKESSKIQNVNINISENTSALKININCAVKKGNVSIVIIDPSDEKQGEFSLESVETEDDGSLFSMLKDGVTGQINKLIKAPQKGNWKIMFIPINATGRVEIQSSQHM